LFRHIVSRHLYPGFAQKKKEKPTSTQKTHDRKWFCFKKRVTKNDGAPQWVLVNKRAGGKSTPTKIPPRGERKSYRDVDGPPIRSTKPGTVGKLGARVYTGEMKTKMGSPKKSVKENGLKKAKGKDLRTGHS